MFARNLLHRGCALLTLAALFSSTVSPAPACGPWLPTQYLAQGGMSLLETPRFFFEIELKLLARDYPTPFRAVREEFPQQRTQERDAEDFDAAIAAGAIHPKDADVARLAHRRLREAIRQYADLTPAERAGLPADVLELARRNVFPSEFADYHEGLLAYSTGDHQRARVVWERLLARPEHERRYRSVQAAFMIGALGVVEDWDDTPEWFARVRDMARHGLPDEAGLAAASYIRESWWYEGRGDLRRAAECALRSIASGYPTKSFLAPKDNSPEELARFAADPLLRKIHTSRLLAWRTNIYNEGDEAQREQMEAWLRALETANVREFAGAERVAWLCYASAEYGRARRWLARAPKNSPRALWLAGKLAARDGKRAESLRAFSAATRLLAGVPEPTLEVTNTAYDENTPDERMAADHAIVAIGAGEFRTALDAFLRGGHWVDAAYVAERLLTTDELKKSIATRPWKDAWAETEALAQSAENESEKERSERATRSETANLRWLLARRLGREGRVREARSFFPPAWRPALDRYARGLADGSKRHLPADKRASGLWEAALEARHHGIELLGTEAAPDWFAYGGDFEEHDPAAYRTGRTAVREDQYSNDGKTIPLPAVLKASTSEVRRLDASEPAPDKRFHYRYRAAALAWSATRLLPDNDVRTVTMLNIAGRWLAGRDPDAADRFYQAIEGRCGSTEIGQRATARRWFVTIAEPVIKEHPEAVDESASQIHRVW